VDGFIGCIVAGSAFVIGERYTPVSAIEVQAKEMAASERNGEDTGGA
jgi:hypothetical protein